MDWQAALRARLVAAAPVAALAGDRVYWIERPQGSALPAVTLQTITEDRAQHFAGFHGTQMARVQADIWAPTYGAARGLAEAVVAAAAPEQSGNGVAFGRGFIDRMADSGERLGEQNVFRVTIDFIIHHAAA